MRSCGEQAAGQLTLQKTGWVAGSLLTLRMHVSHAASLSTSTFQPTNNPVQHQYSTGRHWEEPSSTTGSGWWTLGADQYNHRKKSRVSQRLVRSPKLILKAEVSLQK